MARSSKMILAQECLYSASLRSNEPFAEAISRPTTTADIREIMAIASLTTVVVSELKCSLGRTGPRNRPSKAPPKTHTNTIAPTVLEFTSCLGKSLRRTGRPRAPGGATTVKCPLCAIFVMGALRGRSMLRDTCANSQIIANRPNDQSTVIATTIQVEQRPAPETHRSRTENLEIAEQRLGHARLTRRNVGSSPTPRDYTAEAKLPGWACRIRTCKRHFGKCPLKCPADFASFRNICGPETFPVPAAETPTCRPA